LAPASSGLQDISSPQKGGDSPDVINASFSPEDLWPFPKCGPQKVSDRESKGKKGAILAETSEKLIIEEERSYRKKI
jgi:hypothetical protein